MKPTTDIEQVKSVARALLMTEVYKTPYVFYRIFQGMAWSAYKIVNF